MLNMNIESFYWDVSKKTETSSRWLDKDSLYTASEDQRSNVTARCLYTKQSSRSSCSAQNYEEQQSSLDLGTTFFVEGT